MALLLSFGFNGLGIISIVSDHGIFFIAKEVMQQTEAYVIQRSYHTVHHPEIAGLRS